jgi:hypothetical protein
LLNRKVVSSASVEAGGKFLLKLEKRTVSFVENVKADYLLIASGSSQQVLIDGCFTCITMWVLKFLVIFCFLITGS